jgi:site-specific DNA recombinase
MTEDQIKAAFVAEMNRVIANKGQVLSDVKMLIATLTDMHELEEREFAANKGLEAVSESIRKLVDAYAHALIEQSEYDGQYAELLTQSRALEAQVAEIGEQREQRKARKRELDAFYKVLKAAGPIIEFDVLLCIRLL